MKKNYLKLFISSLILMLSISFIIYEFFSEKTVSESKLNYTNRLTSTTLSKEDYRLLVSFIHAETQQSTYNEKLAVVNVILNRLYNNTFSNNLYDIIYNYDKFVSTSNGTLNKHLWEYDCGTFNTKHHINTLKAVNDALKGKNNIDNRLYYNNYYSYANYSYNNMSIINNFIFW